MQTDAGQGRSDQVEVDALAELAAVAGPLEDQPAHRGLGADDALAERGGELGVAADRGEHARERGDRAVVGEAADAAERREQVAAQGAGVGDLLGALRREQRVDDQRDLAVPAAVERRLRGARGRGDGVHGEPVVADLLEDLEGGVEDLLLTVALDARTSALGVADRVTCGGRDGGQRCSWKTDETKRFRFVRPYNRNRGQNNSVSSRHSPVVWTTPPTLNLTCWSCLETGRNV